MESTMCCNENKNTIELEKTRNKIKRKRGSKTNLQNKIKKSNFVIQRSMSIQFRVKMT